MNNKTPNANRVHIALFGNANVGKSSLLNAIIGQEVAIVSEVKGTTTDPVSKAMELIPFGPVMFTDTAGLDDTTELGEARVKKTKKVMQSADFALYIVDATSVDEAGFEKTQNELKKYSVPFITVINKVDACSTEQLSDLKEKFDDAEFVCAFDNESVLRLKDRLIKSLNVTQDDTIIGDLVKQDGKVIMVVPIDSEAPKGRLILPQVQLIRDCLDHGIKSYVVRDTELESALADMPDVDLVVTDSQAFKQVSAMVPDSVKLTGFSVLFARYKGDIAEFVSGVRKIDRLPEGARVLICESCTHNSSHEDIGRVKIPALIKKRVGKEIVFDFKAGQDFPEDLSQYDLVIHCGACMINKKTVQNRIALCREAGVPITNYGITLAYMMGILDRAVEIFNL